jgi:hypothetical protein
MSNWFPLDMAIGLFVIGVALFILGHGNAGHGRRRSQT